MNKLQHVEVYVFRRIGRKVEFLCLRRSPGRSLAGVWQPVTGKVRQGERAARAAAREVHEETGLAPKRLWGLETVTVYFEPEDDMVHVLPLFAAEIDSRARVRLSHEHDALRFLGLRAAARLFLWEAQRRGIEAVGREVLGRAALAERLEIPQRRTTARTRHSPSRRTRRTR